MVVPLFIPTANVTTLNPYSFCGMSGMSAKHEEHAGWRMPQFRLGYVGRRFSFLGEDGQSGFCALCCPLIVPRKNSWDVEHNSIGHRFSEFEDNLCRCRSSHVH